jgi:hypothetical protein
VSISRNQPLDHARPLPAKEKPSPLKISLRIRDGSAPHGAITVWSMGSKGASPVQSWILREESSERLQFTSSDPTDGDPTLNSAKLLLTWRVSPSSVIAMKLPCETAKERLQLAVEGPILGVGLEPSERQTALVGPLQTDVRDS